MRALRTFFAAPVTDVLDGLEHSLAPGARGLALVVAGLLAGWWVYVPVHELLHAAACWLAGGEVSRLEISPLYGGALLARLFPFVVAEGDYAGRLAGFDTGGSDLVYLATDLGPYVLTIFPGVWALRRFTGFGYGFALPFALAPFLSLTGDAYEIGSIVVTRLPAWSGIEALRGDDLFRLVPELAKLGDPPWGGVILAFVVGVSWAFVTYALGRWVAARVTPAIADRL
ncbi:MAG: hypothetical protein GY719_37205 [bacterium]|nr:hypothetical protein [bacterium]